MGKKKTDIFLRPDEELEFSKEEAAHIAMELYKCKNDVLYFATTYATIIGTKGKQIMTDPYPFQEEIFRNFLKYKRWEILASRQVGKSTFSAIVLTHYMLFNEDKFIALVSKDMSGAKEVLQKINTIYSLLPKWLQKPVISFGKETVELANGNRVMCFPVYSDKIRGFTIDFLYLDEFAFLHPNIADTFITGVFPTVSSREDANILITTTPKGYNHFYDFWKMGRDNPTKEDIENGLYKRMKIRWSDIPGRDEKWKMRRINGDLKGDEMLFEQEYNCEFISTFKSSLLKVIEGYNYIEKPQQRIEIYDKEKNKSVFETTEIFDEHDYLYLYDDIKYIDDYDDSYFICGIDPSEGLGEDFTVLNILRYSISEKKFYQYFRYTTNMTDPRDLHAKVDHILNVMMDNRIEKLYIENNQGGGGKELINRLLEIENTNVDYESIMYADKLSKRNNTYGLRTTEKSKATRVKDLGYMLNNYLIIHDKVTATQLRSIIKNGRKIEANLSDDDEVSSLWQLTPIIDDPFFKKLQKVKNRTEEIQKTPEQHIKDRSKRPLIPTHSNSKSAMLQRLQNSNKTNTYSQNTVQMTQAERIKALAGYYNTRKTRNPFAR